MLSKLAQCLIPVDPEWTAQTCDPKKVDCISSVKYLEVKECLRCDCSEKHSQGLQEDTEQPWRRQGWRGSFTRLNAASLTPVEKKAGWKCFGSTS